MNIWIVPQSADGQTAEDPESHSSWALLSFTNFSVKRFLIFQAPVSETIPQRAVSVGLVLDLYSKIMNNPKCV